MRNYVAYYRVSTAKQGESGLGLAAQRTMVRKYIGDKGPIVKEFTEIETGTGKRERPEIRKALEWCREFGCILVVAKLDRLTRNVQFTSTLFQSGVEFYCADNPHANKFTIQLMSILAEDEAEKISQRTKAALQEKKKQGVKLGNPNGINRKAQLAGANAMREKAARGNAQVSDIVKDKRRFGYKLREIAEHLNKLDYRTPSGKKFTAKSVHRLL